MHLSIVDVDPDVTGIGAGQRSFRHLLVDTLQDSGHELEIDGSADNAVVELELAAPLEVLHIAGLDSEDFVLSVDLELGWPCLAFYVRAYDEGNLAELSCAAGLLLVAVACGRCLRDSLPVGNLRLEELGAELVFVCQSPLHEVDLLLAHAGQDRLAALIVVTYRQGRILGGNLVESLADLRVVVLVGSLDRAEVLVVGIGDVRDRLDTLFSEGRVSLSCLELHRTSDISGVDSGHLDLVCASYGIYCGESFSVSGLGIDEIDTLPEDTACYLEVGNVSEVGFNIALEDEDLCRAFHGILRDWGGVDDELHQPLDADVSLCGNAENGHCKPLCDVGGKTLADFVDVEGTFLEVFHCELVVSFRCLVHQGLVELVDLGGIFCRDVKFLAVAVLVLVLVHLHREDIDEAVVGGSGIQRNLDLGDLLSICGLQGFEGALPLSLLAVKLIDRNDHRDLVLVGVAGENLRSHLDALLGVYDEDCAFAYLERRDSAAAEVIGTRRIDDVELLVHEFGEKRCGEH